MKFIIEISEDSAALIKRMGVEDDLYITEGQNGEPTLFEHILDISPYRD